MRQRWACTGRGARLLVCNCEPCRVCVHGVKECALRVHKGEPSVHL